MRSEGLSRAGADQSVVFRPWATPLDFRNGLKSDGGNRPGVAAHVFKDACEPATSG